MKIEKILEFSQKLYEQIADSGMSTKEAIFCAEMLKNSIVYNDYFLTFERTKNEYQRGREEN